MNAGDRSHPRPAAEQHRLEEALESGWFGCDDGTAGSTAAAQAAERPDRAQGNGWLSWLFHGIGGNSSSSTGNNPRGVASGVERRPARRPGQAGKAALKPRRGTAAAEGTTARLPRPPSAPKLQTAVAASGSGTSSTQQQAGPNAVQTPKDGGPQPDSKRSTVAAGNGKPSRPQDGKMSASSRAAAKKAANYAERRHAWRQRIEAIKSKQATRAAGTGPQDTLLPAFGGSRGVFSKHIAIPVPPPHAGGGGRPGSTHNTPYGSPKHREPLLDDAGAVLPQLEAPPVWQGFQTAEAPPDLAAASEEQLLRFLQQAGWFADAVLCLSDHEALVLAARGARSAWEVERVIVACAWPEEVLRVPRKCPDAGVLKAAYRRVSMAVHPDKCNAVGASDAMSIVADCYSMLLAAASGGKAAAAVPAFMRQHHPTRAVHSSNSVSNLAAASGAAAAGGPGPTGGGQQQGPFGDSSGAEQQRQQRRQTADPPESQAPPLQQQRAGGLHSRHASAESFFGMDSAGIPVWADLQQQQQAARHGSSSGPDWPPLRHSSGSVGSQEHWHPHWKLSSEELEAGLVPSAAADADADTATTCSAGAEPAEHDVPSPAAAALSSRSSSASSFVRAAAAALQAQHPDRGSYSSLAGSSGAASGPLQMEAEAEASSRPGSSSSLRGSGGPPSPQLPNGSQQAAGGGWTAAAGSPEAAGRTSPAAAAASAGRRGSPQPPANGGGPPRPAAAGGGTAPAKAGTAAGLASVASSSGAAQARPKIRVTLKVRQA